jgi:hypothetical protein
MGNIPGAMIPAIFPEAGNFPVIAPSMCTMGRSRTTALTVSRNSDPARSVPAATGAEDRRPAAGLSRM